MSKESIDDAVNDIVGEVQAVQDKTKAEEVTEATETADGLKLNVRTFEKIQTAAEALMYAGIDPAIWKPEKVTAKSYQVTLGAKNTESGKPETKQMFAVSVTCKRRFEESLINAVDAIAKRAHKRAYKLPTVRHRKPKKDPSHLVIGLTDIHFGKLAYEPEVRQSYDLKIARDLWTRAVRAAVDHCTGHDIEKIILPVGNDMAHCDTRAMTTESGTPMDTDTRYEKMSDVMEESLLLAVADIRASAPVEVVWVPGNHDYLTSRWLCRCVHHAFSGDKHISVDTGDCPVKYRHFGECLLAFAHGNAPKVSDLHRMMPVEMADQWAVSKACREILTGHFHKTKNIESVSTNDEAGIVSRILPSLCAADSYHYRGGWSLAKKSTHSLLYSNKYGITSIFNDSVKRLLAR